MAIPGNSSGEEVLKREHIAGVTNSENVLINGVANHIYTILSMSVCETLGTAETFDMWLDASGGGTDFFILYNQPIGANETFIWNDRLVLSGEDHLCMATASAANLDVVISYIDQNWT